MTDHVNIPLITITADEYYNLRNKAEMNGFYIQKLVELESSMACLNERVYALEKANERNN